MSLIEIIPDSEQTSTFGPMSSGLAQLVGAAHLTRAYASETAATATRTQRVSYGDLFEKLAITNQPAPPPAVPPPADDLGKLLQAIASGAAPAITPERRALAEAAVAGNERRRDENVEAWAKRVATSSTKIDD